jgi:hypothetical protein
MDCAALKKAIDAYIRKADDDLESTLRAAGFWAAAQILRRVHALEPRIDEILTAQATYLLDAWHADPSPEEFYSRDLPALAAADTTGKALGELFTQEFPAALVEFTGTHLQHASPDLAVGMVTDQTSAFFRNWAPELGRLMKLNDYDVLEQTLVKAMHEGWGVNQTMKAIYDSRIRDTAYRARRVALTETMRAHNAGAYDAMLQDPRCVDKRWRHTGGWRITPRDNHVAMDGQIRPKDEPFELVGRSGDRYAPYYPVDPSLPAEESINCHCLADPIRASDAELMNAVDLRARQRMEIERANRKSAQGGVMAAHSDTIRWPEKGLPLSPEKLAALTQRAEYAGVALKGFEGTDANAHVLERLIDSAGAVVKRYPQLQSIGGKPLTLHPLRNGLGDNDFAKISKGSPHIIHLNPKALRSEVHLAEEYGKLASEGWFVRGTDYRHIVYHEAGHVLDASVDVDGLAVARQISGVPYDTLHEYVANEVSKYGTASASELVAEAVSASMMEKPSGFALTFLRECGILYP